MREFEKPTIILSSCIEHFNCRYDGSKISNNFIKKLKNYANFITVCPEVSIGLPIPRDALRLILSKENEERLVFSKTGEDITEKMDLFSKSFLESLEEIEGIILKSHSPSCGFKDAKVYKDYGKSPSIPRKTSGIFTKKIMEKFSDISIQNDGSLTNYNIREHFLTRVFTSATFKVLKKEKSMHKLIEFQSENKYLLMAYSPSNLKKLGKITANNEEKEMGEILSEYEYYLNKALAMMPKPMRNVNMLLHLFGYFSKYLSNNEKAFFLEKLEKYSNKKVPFSVPLAIIHSWAMRFENEYLLKQTIFEPFPSDLIEVTDSGKGI